MTDTPTYSLILTNYGKEKEQECLLNETALGVSHIAIGDGNGEFVNVTPDMVSLVNQTNSFPVYSVERLNDTITAKVIIPFTTPIVQMREMGLFDDKGNMLAIQNCACTNKSDGSDGENHEITLQFDLSIFQTAVHPLITNINTNMATQEWVVNYLKYNDLGYLNACGIISENDPFGLLEKGANWALPDATSDWDDITTFPISVNQKNVSGYLVRDYTPKEGDLWTFPDGSQRYWSLGKWENLNFTVDLSPYRPFRDQDIIDANKKLRYFDISDQVDGVTSTFTVNTALLNSASVLVAVNGLLEFNFSYDEATGELLLAYPPEEGTDLKILNI